MRARQIAPRPLPQASIRSVEKVACFGTIQKIAGPSGSSRMAATMASKQRRVFPLPARPITIRTAIVSSAGFRRTLTDPCQTEEDSI
jgi:hypothetical protein